MRDSMDCVESIWKILKYLECLLAKHHTTLSAMPRQSWCDSRIFLLPQSENIESEEKFQIATEKGGFQIEGEDLNWVGVSKSSLKAVEEIWNCHWKGVWEEPDKISDGDPKRGLRLFWKVKEILRS